MVAGEGRVVTGADLVRALADLRSAVAVVIDMEAEACTARIRPLPNDTELRCGRPNPPHDRHEAVLADYAWPGSRTVIVWAESDRRNFHGEWSPCPWPYGCVLPATHGGSHAR